MIFGAANAGNGISSATIETMLAHLQST